MEWIKILLSSTVLIAVIGIIGRALGWKFSPREKADVQKVQSEIRIDDANITSKKIEDEIKVSQQALEWTAQFAAQLEKANAVIDKLQIELEKMRVLNEKIRQEYGKQIQELQDALEEEKAHCREIKAALNKLQSKYGTE